MYSDMIVLLKLRFSVLQLAVQLLPTPMEQGWKTASSNYLMLLIRTDEKYVKKKRQGMFHVMKNYI